MIAERVYAALLLAFPRRFRARYAAGMRQIFRERYGRARADHRRARFLIRSVVDVLSNGALERAGALRQWMLFPQFHDQLARCERRRRPMVWQALAMDVRYALRMFARTPMFTGLTVLALALGIGANSAIFTVVDSVLLEPLPYANPERLVMVWNDNTREGVPQYPMSPANFLDVKASTRTLERVEMMYSFLVSAAMRTGEGTERIVGAGLTPGMFELLGRGAAFGRTLRPADRAGLDIVLSDGFWRRRFGADSRIIGRQLTINDQAATIVGVMPPDFHFPLKTMLGPSGFSNAVEPDAWFPLDATGPQFVQNGLPVRTVHYLSVVGRLAPGATVEQADEEIRTIAARLEAQFPDVNRGLKARVVPLHEQAVGRARPALVLLLAGVGFVLLIACVNVANLLLARSAARQREIAVRTALGAGRPRLLAQMLVESGLLAAAGGVLALGFVVAGVRVLLVAAPPELPRLNEVTPDGTVVLFTALVAILAGLLVGTAPAIAAGRSEVRSALTDASRGIVSGMRRHVRAALVVGEIALAVVLTVGAGLLLHSFQKLVQVDPGFRTDNLLTMQVSLPGRLATADARRAFYAGLFERLDAIPGVTATGGTTRLPLGSTNVTTRVLVEGRPMTPGEMPEVEMRRAVHRYFEAMGMPILRGRSFTAEDGPATQPVAVVNQTMARRLWPHEDPVGRRFKMGANPQTPWTTVIGVVGDVRHTGLDVEPVAEFYIWYTQGPPVAPFLVVRTTGDPAAIAETVRAELKAFEKDLAVYDMQTMTQVRAASVAGRRFVMALAMAFGLLALVLAAVGVYGVMALVVTERTQEIGVRLALGAEPRQVLGLIMRQGMVLAAAGIGVGLAGGLALGPLMAGQLYGIGAADPATLTGVPVLLLAVALLACVVPARRAMRVDPLTALRYE